MNAIFPSFSARYSPGRTLAALNHLIHINLSNPHQNFHTNAYSSLARETYDNPQNLLPKTNPPSKPQRSERKTYLWNSEFTRLVKLNKMEEVLESYNQMKIEKTVPDKYTFVPLLKACAGLHDLQKGMQIHEEIKMLGIESDIFVGTSLIDMYAKCGCMTDAYKVFCSVPTKDIVCYNSMVVGFSQNGQPLEAIRVFASMQFEGFYPNVSTVVSIIPACNYLGLLKEGKSVHGYVVRRGITRDVSVRTCFVDMYAKVGSMRDAQVIFDGIVDRDLVCWNAMIGGYGQNGYALDALRVFQRMCESGMKPDHIAMINVIPSCGSGFLNHGRLLHSYIISNGVFLWDVMVTNCLIDMYAKCKDIESAHLVFDTMERDVVTWNTMVYGYLINDDVAMALKTFRRMMDEGMRPNDGTLATVLPACADMSALLKGKSIHAYILRNGFVSYSLATSLVVMYAKCGCIDIGRKVFDKMPAKDIITWTALIAGYGIHGYCDEAIKLFGKMERDGLVPNHVTFVGILTACSHGGLVEKGWWYFDRMKKYDLSPRLEHYVCMVDILGRNGDFEAAFKLIGDMPMESDSSIWAALLGACKLHSKVDLVKSVLERLSVSDPQNVGNYVLASNIYASAGRWEDVANVRNLLRSRGLKKTPGCSWIEIKGQVYVFDSKGFAT